MPVHISPFTEDNRYLPRVSRCALGYIIIYVFVCCMLLFYFVGILAPVLLVIHLVITNYSEAVCDVVLFISMITCRCLDEILTNFTNGKPDIIAYNAGTDCMVDDPLGALNISPEVLGS